MVQKSLMVIHLSALSSRIFVINYVSLHVTSTYVCVYVYCVCVCVRVCVPSCSVVSDSATSQTVAHQAPLSMGFPRQEYWSGLPFLLTGDLPH